MPTRSNRVSASFAWDILKSDAKLLTYPMVRIAIMFTLLAVMWHHIFDISALQVGQDMTDAVNQASNQAIDTRMNSEFQSSEEYQQQTQAAQSAMNNVFDHMHIGPLLLFFVLNAFFGVFSVGALTAQAVAIARGESRGVLYGYMQALLRLPQLVIWWLVTIIVGVLLSMLESHKILGAIVASIIGAAWHVLTFFSITAIMATGCGPIGAVTHSKDTIVDACKKCYGEGFSGSIRDMRRGLYIGGPLAAINALLALALIGTVFLDLHPLHGGGHGLSMGAFAAIMIMLMISGAFTAACWAIVKATIYVWAEEGVVQDTVDESVLEHSFVQRGSMSAALS